MGVWLGAVVYAICTGFMANLATTVYLHRALSHRALVLHPAVAHFFRFWLWLTTGTDTRGWVAVHRKHHAFTDRPGDPHSPALHGTWRIVLGNYWYYRDGIRDAATLDKYGEGCPDDWIERRLYKRHDNLGLLLLWASDFLLLPWRAALLAVALQMVWMPLMGGLINGLGHVVGYRNHDLRDQSRNLSPIAILIAGEELHNNHHFSPRSASFASRPWELDAGWLCIRALAGLGLARDVYWFGRRWDGATPPEEQNE